MTVIIECEPKGKGRPRFKIVGGHVQTYTPKETREYEKLIATQYFKQGGKRHKGPVDVTIFFSMPIPKSTSKADRKRMEFLDLLHTKKPDIDNLAKAVLDALVKAGAIEDDRFVVRLLTMKTYSEVPRVSIEIKEYKEIKGYKEEEKDDH